jgi:hypothetical protein
LQAVITQISSDQDEDHENRQKQAQPKRGLFDE